MKGKMRELILYPKKDEFTQGSIFEGLTINSDSLYTNGIIITARCDIANEKARNILCLPIYKVNDWINRQGNEIIYRRVESKLLHKICIELKKFRISLEIIDTYPIDNILSIIENDKKVHDKESIKKMLYMYRSKECDHTLDFVDKERKNLISEIIRNTEASTYFIEQIDFDNILEPYVIDLAEPISIPLKVAKRLLNGIKKERNKDDWVVQYLTLYKDEISYISLLKSPYIEHVLQKFSSYYSRIGTDDISKEAEDILKEKLNEM